MSNCLLKCSAHVGQAQDYVRSLPLKKKVHLKGIIPTTDIEGKSLKAPVSSIQQCQSAIDLLEKMLAFDPDQRITVPEALEHPWLSAYHDMSDEPECQHVFDRWQDIERLETLDDFREALWNEIEDYRREVRGLNFVSPKRNLSTTSVKEPELLTPITREERDQERSVFEHDTIREEDSAEIETTSTAVEDEQAMKIICVDPEQKDMLPQCKGTEISYPFPLAAPADPMVMYARRSSILQPSRQNSTYNSPVPPTQHLPVFLDSHQAHQSETGGVAFPTQGYVYPARSRTGSTVGGEITRKILRTLSTVSIHEGAEGLASIATIGKFIVDGRTEADAPPSEMPRDFGIKSAVSEGSEEGKTGGQSKKGGKFSLD